MPDAMGKQHMALIPALISFLHLDSDEEGQGLAEYALILALIAIVAIVALIFLGGQVSRHPPHRRHLGLGTAPAVEERPPAPPAAALVCGTSVLASRRCATTTPLVPDR